MARGIRAALLVLLAAPGTHALQDSKAHSADLIDSHLLELRNQNRVSRAGYADDFELLRRLCLDLEGQLPAVDEIRDFKASEDPNKYAKKVDALLRSPWFSYTWGERMTNYLLGYPRQFDYFTDRKGMMRWIRDRLKDPKARMDEIARDILAARSDGADSRATGFLTQFAEYKEDGRVVLRIEQVAGRASTAFLGVRLHCAQCHDHPADRWTQEDFAGMAAFFARTTFGRDDVYGMTLTDGAKALDYKFEGLQGSLAPRFLDGGTPQGDDWRADFARRLTAHPLFARAFVNRVWAWLFGKGIVDPLDDMHAGRKPVAPALLDALARDFADHGYDLRHLVRSICNSEAYSLTSRRSKGDDERAERFFARSRVRPMTPEQLFQAISLATDLHQSQQDDDAILALLGGQNQTGEQKKYFVVRNWFIDMMIKTSDEAATTNFSTYTANIQQVLHALNKELPLFAGAKGESGGRLQKLLRKDDDEVVSGLFLASMSRLPTAREMTRCLDHVKKASDRTKGFEEVFWSLLNTDEFLFNH